MISSLRRAASSLRQSLERYRESRTVPAPWRFGPDDPWDIDLPSTLEAEAVSENLTEHAQQFLSLLGKAPRRGARPSTTIRSTAHHGYTLTSLHIAGGADYDIPAMLCTPHTGDSRRPLPAIVVAHGHAREGRWGKSKLFQKNPRNPSDGYALDLVRRGYVVLAVDLAGFEERRPAHSQPGPWLTDDERLTAGNLILRGATPLGVAIFDLSRAVDFLTAHPAVDAARIAAMGHSMGASLVPPLMLFDSRVAAGISVSGLSTWRAMMRRHAIHNYAVYVPALLSVGDLDTILPGIAPKHFAVVTGELDQGFPVSGARALAAAMAARYEALGCPSRFMFAVHPGNHAFDSAPRTAAYRFLDDWAADEPGKAEGGRAN